MQNQQSLMKYTSLARSLDPGYPTNLAIMIVVPVVTVLMSIILLVRGEPLLDSIGQGILRGGAVFIAWILSREIDPDHELSAFVSVALMIIVSFFVKFHIVDMIALGLLISMLRTLDRVTGQPATILDSLVVLGGAMLLGILGDWVYLPIAGFVFALDFFLPISNRKQSLFIIGAFIFARVALSMNDEHASAVGLPEAELVGVLLAVMIGFLIFVFSTKKIYSTVDYGHESLSTVRIKATQIFTLLFAILVTYWYGKDGAMLSSPLWVSFVGIVLYAVLEKFLVQRK